MTIVFRAGIRTYMLLFLLFFIAQLPFPASAQSFDSQTTQHAGSGLPTHNGNSVCSPLLDNFLKAINSEAVRQQTEEDQELAALMIKLNALADQLQSQIVALRDLEKKTTNDSNLQFANDFNSFAQKEKKSQIEKVRLQVQITKIEIEQLRSELNEQLVSRPGGPPEGAQDSFTVYTSRELNIFFPSGKAEINPFFLGQLVSLTQEFMNSSTGIAILDSYTDQTGSSQSNREMARKRASSVFQVMRNLGVSRSIVCANIHGEDWNSVGLEPEFARRVTITFHFID